MSDYNFLMESKLSPRQFRVVNLLAQAASAEGLNFYLVGGAVRDLTYGQPIVRDLDFAVEGHPEKILRHLQTPRPGGRRGEPGPVPPHEDEVWVEEARYSPRWLSAEIYFSSGVRAEVSQCRREDYSQPGKPPEIVPATIFEDLRRRDFALNAMAVSLHPNSRGLLLDPTNGGGDIERKEIRALHSRSFIDDPSRIFRLVRLTQRLGFKPEEKTETWLRSALAQQLQNRLTPEQQGRELEAILREENPARTLKLFADRGWLTALDRNLARLRYERLQKIHALAQKFPEDDLFLLNLDALAGGLSAAQRVRLAKKIIRFPGMLKLALHLEREAKKLSKHLLSSRAASPSQVWRLLSPQPRILLLYLLAYSGQSGVQNRIKHYLFKAPQIQARLPRLELQALGVNPGPKMEEILGHLFFDQLDGKIKTSQQLSKAMRSLAGVREPTPLPPTRTRAKPKKSSPATPAHPSDQHETDQAGARPPGRASQKPGHPPGTRPHAVTPRRKKSPSAR